MRRLVLAGVLTAVFSACMMRNPNYVSDDAFASMYPQGYATVVRSDIRLRLIDEMIEDAESSYGSAKLLRKSIDARFDALFEGMEWSETWAEVALTERWGQAFVEQGTDCKELRGAAEYVAARADDSARALISWRAAVVAELEAMRDAAEILRELSKIEPYFLQVAAGIEQNPSQMSEYWSLKLGEKVRLWEQRQSESEQLKVKFEALKQDFESFRASLPDDSACPLVYANLENDPISAGIRWYGRAITPPVDLEAIVEPETPPM